MIAIGSLLLTVGAGLLYTEYFKLTDVLLVSFLLLFPTLFNKRFLIFGIILGLLCFVGAFYFSIKQRDVDLSFFGKRDFQAKIVSVDKKIEGTNLTVLDNQYQEKIRIHTKNSGFLSGDVIYISGNTLPVEDFLTETNRIFPYEKYLQSKGISGVMYDPDIKNIVDGELSLRRFSDIIRFDLAKRISKYVHYPYDGIISGMILGYRGGLSSEVEDVFFKTGTIHVLVLSGYNIMLLAGFCVFLFSRFPRIFQISFTSISIILLVFISGAGIAAMRAGIMGIIALSSKFFIEKYNPARALTLAYLILFFWSPMSVFVDPGLHLSFLATLCMILIVPKFEKYFQFIPENKYFDIRGAISVSLIASFYMLPYILFFSGNFSLSFFLANILLSLVIPILMIFGVGILVFSPFSILSTILGNALSYLLDFVFYILEVLSLMPIYYTPPFSGWGVIGIYILLNLFLFRKDLWNFICNSQIFFQRPPN